MVNMILDYNFKNTIHYVNIRYMAEFLKYLDKYVNH